MPYRSFHALPRALRRCAVVLTAALVAPVAAAAPAAAADTDTTYVTILGGGDYVGQTDQQLFHPGNGKVAIGGSTTRVNVSLDGGTHGKWFYLNLSVPSGQELVAGGTYESASGAGISLSGDGRGCGGTVPGSWFTVDDIAATTTALTRVALTYWYTCDGVKYSTGSVVYNAPRDADLMVAGDRLGWAPEYREATGRVRTLFLLNRGTEPVTTSAPVFSGEHAADYSVVTNGCATIAAGAICTIMLRFTPGAAGQRDATLTVPASTPKGSYAVALSGRGIPGHTSFHMRSEGTDDWIGQGKSYDYTPADSGFRATGGPSMFDMRIDSGNAWWSVDIEAGDGQVFVPGTTVNGALRASFTNGPGLDVSGSGRGCNQLTGSFTIIEAAYRDGAGAVERFAATFEQYCDGSTDALNGWVSWRASAPNVPGDIDGGGGDGGGGEPGPMLPVTDLTAYPDAASLLLGWTMPAGATSVVVRGAQGLTPPATVTSGEQVYAGPGSSVYVGSLMPGASYSFTVFTRDGAGRTGPGASVTLRGSTLTVTRPSVVTYPSPATVGVRLVDTVTGAPRAGAAVELFARKKGAREYFWVDTLTTGSTGTASLALGLDQSYEFQATYYGAGHALGATAGPALVAVRTRVGAALSAASVPRYGPVTVKGSVGPNKAGRYVYLQKWSDGAWRNVAKATLSASSTYAMTFRPGTRGTWKLRVYRPSDSAHAAGASVTRSLSVT